MARLGDIHVPPEILQQIVRQLDPISVIALSQASRSWRAFINPIRHDFVQRLLALELLPEHGGLVPEYDESYEKLTPPFDSDQWKSAKYACCACMKLRRHMMFDNHAILRRAFRKPPPGSIEVGRAAITEWEPLEPSLRWRHIRERDARAASERQKWLPVANWRHYPPDQPTQPFAPVPRPENEADVEALKYLVGISRQKRRCIDCQRRRGHWSRPHPLSATREAPALISRQFKFSSIWERHFPGLMERLPAEKVPRNWRVMRDSTDGIWLNLYLVCCPSCDTWQKHSAFRNWEMYRRGFRYCRGPTRPLLCNRCHLATHQDPARLAQELADGAIQMLREERRGMLGCLRFGWKFIYEDLGLQTGPLAKHKDVAEKVIGGLNWIETSPGAHTIEVDETQFPDLRRRLHHYREFVYGQVDAATRSSFLHSWYKLWVEDYDLIEEMYHWLGQQIARLEKEPKLVLDYVLERDPYRI